MQQNGVSSLRDEYCAYLPCRCVSTACCISAGGRVRTYDLEVKSFLLYRLSYARILLFVVTDLSRNNTKTQHQTSSSELDRHLLFQVSIKRKAPPLLCDVPLTGHTVGLAGNPEAGLIQRSSYLQLIACRVFETLFFA